MDRIDWAALLLAIGVVSFQIFMPPVIGLADNGDFVKVTGRFNLYLPQGQVNGFADTTYAIDRQHHWVSEHISSEILLAGLAVALNRMFSSATFDLRWIGAVHAALYLLAFFFALTLLRGLPVLRRVILIAIIIFMLGDVMFVSALNSFYMDTAAWIFICLGGVLYLRAWRDPTKVNRIVVIVCLTLLITAKTQHIVAGCVLFLLIVVTHRQLGLDRLWLTYTAAATAVALGIAYMGTPKHYSGGSVFSVIFYGLMPYSKDVDRDLRQLGLDESYRRWVGMHSYSQGAPRDDVAFVRAFDERTGFGHVALYYARHPEQPWRILIESLAEAGRQRPYLGNYDRRSGARELQESHAFSAWSGLNELLFYHNGKRYLGYVLAVLALLCTLAWTQRHVHGPAIFAAAIAFAALTVIEMLICSLGDMVDNLRHEFMFNGLTSLAVVFLAALLISFQPHRC